MIPLSALLAWLLSGCAPASPDTGDSTPVDTEETADTGPEPPEWGVETRPSNPTCSALLPPWTEAPPDDLAATGCVDPLDPTQPAAGLIPYDLNAPFWSDGAVKRRWVGLPDGATVAAAADGDLEFPAGTVLVKMFDVDTTLVETRLLLRDGGGEWTGWSYRWNDEGTAAARVTDSQFRDLGDQWWFFPGPLDCLFCHQEVSGRALGPEIGQLNRDLTYPSGVTSNQLDTWSHIGLFDPAIPAAVDSAVLPDPLGSADLESRARSWLHTNCSHCHRPGGPSTSEIDLRYAIPLAETGTCGVVPSSSFGVTDPLLIAPGEPDRSVVYTRSVDPDFRMPPIGSLEIDTIGSAVVRDWIAALAACPP